MNQILIFCALILIVCILAHKLSDRIGVPVLIAFIGIGMMCGVDGILKIPFDNFAVSENMATIALIFIMFYGGFCTKWVTARKSALPAVLLSSAGVFITAVVTAVIVHFVVGTGWLFSFLIGSVLSSTDAASVFYILRSRQFNLKYNTSPLLEVESGSNDPAAYLMTVICIALLRQDNSLNVPWLLLKQLVFGLGFGVLIGFVTGWILQHFNFMSTGLSAVFVLAIALISYALPSVLDGNGFLSTYLAGIIIGNFDIQDKRTQVTFFDGITDLMQMMLFFLLGLLCTPSNLSNVLVPAAVVAFVITFLARPAAVFLLMRPLKAPNSQMLLVSWCGLRGAASIVFAIMAVNSVPPVGMEFDIFSMVFLVVLFSIIIQGSLLPWAARKLSMIDTENDVMKTFNDYSDSMPVRFIQFTMPEEYKWNGREVRNITLPPDTRLVLIQRTEKNKLGIDTVKDIVPPRRRGRRRACGRPCLIVEEGVGLEVVLKRAEVDVGGAAGAHGVVADHCFGVEKAAFVEQHLDACLHGLAQVAAAGPLHEEGVAASRHHDAHVHARSRCRLHGEEHRVGGQEVGRLDVDVVLGRENGAHVALHDFGIGGHGAAGDGL